MDGDVLPGIRRSIGSAADYDNVEVLGVQARNSLRYLHQEVAEHGRVGDADHAFVVTLGNTGTAWQCKVTVHQVSRSVLCKHERCTAAAAEQGCQAMSAH